MVENPFNRSLDWALQGKRARVYTDHGTFEGTVERVHHSRGSVVMHDCTETNENEDLGAVFIRDPGLVVTLDRGKRIEWRRLADLTSHPDYPGDFTPKDDVVRRCCRNRYAGSFPVVREDGTIINGHKRVAAARVAGLDRHPVEVLQVTDEQASELLRVAHRSIFEQLEDEESDETE